MSGMNKHSVNWTNKSGNCKTMTALLNGCLKSAGARSSCEVYRNILIQCNPKKIRQKSGSSDIFKDFVGS